MKLIKASSALLLCLSAAHAFVPSGSIWDFTTGETIPFIVNHTLSEDLEDEAALEMVLLSYDVWNRLTCATIEWSYEGRTDNFGWGEGDGLNVVTWRESNWGDSSVALGITSLIWDSGGSLQDTDIKFNGEHHQWSAFREGDNTVGRIDIASVGAHEVGHALGLDHSEVANATMWPTDLGGTMGRSLSADDIEGACTLYPSGGEVPAPEEDPILEEGTIQYDEDCSAERCAPGLFCLNDGLDLYCSQRCAPGDDEICGENHYCATLTPTSGACVRGVAPATQLGGLGDECGAVACQLGLRCVSDPEFAYAYCAGACANGTCPTDFVCTALEDGGDMCLRAPPPTQGEDCTAEGLCAHGYICLQDALNADQITGEPATYCTVTCADGACPDGFRCISLGGGSTACEMAPFAGDNHDEVGEPCWIDPEEDWREPSCGGGLLCVEYQMGSDGPTERGYCTKTCTADDCCPDGWGCLEVTPVFGQCQDGASDSPGFACGGAEPAPDAEAPTPVDAAIPEPDPDAGLTAPPASDDGDDGCAQSGVSPAPLPLLLGLLALGLPRRRR
ncbi:matrixin family metalloprotease [Myxococcota bacterium]|nr:matrixin family metalloprotease [Myxococcota bacterium]